jgi:hypothetical protein
MSVTDKQTNDPVGRRRIAARLAAVAADLKRAADLNERLQALEAERVRLAAELAAIDAAPLELRCVVCGEPFTAVKSSGGRHPRFCSEECRTKQRAAQNARYRAEGRYVGPRRKKHRVCPACGRAFETGNSRTKCCSVKCGVRHARRTRQACGDLFADDGGITSGKT